MEFLIAGDEQPDTPVALRCTGWRLGEVHGFLRDDAAAFVTWLDTAPQFTAQPWAEVAAFYDRAGQPGQARQLRVAMEQRATARLSPSARWLRRAFYGGTVGYGYTPFRAVWWLLGLGLSAAAIAWFFPEAFTLDQDASADVTTQPARPHPGIVALETVLPAAATAITNPWQATDFGVQAVLTVFKTSSWLLAALFVAGITGLLRKRAG